MTNATHYQNALTLLQDFNMESALCSEIGEAAMYGTPEQEYEDVDTRGFAVMLNTDTNAIEIWKNITTEDRGWAHVAQQQNPVILLGYITPNDAFSSGCATIEDAIKAKMYQQQEP